MPRTIKEIDKDIRTFMNKYEQAKMSGDQVGQRRYFNKVQELQEELERTIRR